MPCPRLVSRRKPLAMLSSLWLRHDLYRQEIKELRKLWEEGGPVVGHCLREFKQFGHQVFGAAKCDPQFSGRARRYRPAGPT